MAPYRMDGGARLDRSRPIAFTFDGRPYEGFAGDTVASALLGAGRALMGRSFKYHRPRGVLGLGVEEPNALVTVGADGRATPNLRATMVPLTDGLVVTSQNRWPSLERDLQSVNRLGGPAFSAGFYYKTFIAGGVKAWKNLYEPAIRRAAGLGHAPSERDPDRYGHVHEHCDVLVVGAGPAGLAAALAAARSGARVILADDGTQPGGLIDLENARVEAAAGADWARAVPAEIEEHGARILRRTNVWGYYDDDTLAAAEQVDGHVRERHWRITAARVVLATGAIERPLVFAGNDKPGIMTVSSALAHVRRQAVAPGREVVVFANNDWGWRAARDLQAIGVGVRAVVDPRREVPAEHREELGRQGVDILTGHVVVRAEGGNALKRLQISRYDSATNALRGEPLSVDADALLVSGGWTPSVHLASQAGTPPVYDVRIGAFLPGKPTQNWRSAGALNGAFATAACIAAGAKAGARAAREAGFQTRAPALRVENQPDGGGFLPLWEVPSAGRKGWLGEKAFVDFQNDVTADDLRLAASEGYRALEHAKRYTTLGMATDQGKTSNVNGLAILAEARSLSIPEVGTTRFRPPYAPVTLGAIAGREVGSSFRPERLTPIHDWHVENGAEMVATGPWWRPRAYLRDGETITDAYVREARAVRDAVGITDVSTLGKIEVSGPDAAAFLDRLYCNAMGGVAVGKARYGLMLREDGFVLDDGTAWRLAEDRYLVTTTTAMAARIMEHMEFLHAAHWSDLRVTLTSVTEQWAGVAVAGPLSRALLERVIEECDLSDAATPMMAVRRAAVGGVPALVARLSFSGERAYEVYVGADHGVALWEALLDAGEPLGAVPYGLEAMGTLRIEKGHPAGPELDGRVTVDDLGFGRMASTKKPYVGSVLRRRPKLVADDRLQMVGIVAQGDEALRAGAHLLNDSLKGDSPVGSSQGHVTSVTYSPVLQRQIALAFLRNGRARHGESVIVTDPLRGSDRKAEVVPPCFVDPEGERMRG